MLVLPTKQAGHCTRCNKAVFDIISKYSTGLLAGRVQSVGAPHDDAVKVDMVMTDESRLSLTYCEDCAALLDVEDIRYAWIKVREGWTAEADDEYRKALGLQPLNPLQRENLDTWLALMADEALMGVVSQAHWTEVDS